MNAVQLSRALRITVETQLTAHFNAYLAADLAEFGMSDQAFTIIWTPGTNYFRTLVELAQMRDYLAQSWPSMQLFTAALTLDAHEQMPVTFEGPVQLRMTTFYRWQAHDQADMQSLPETVEGVLAKILTSIDGLAQGSLEITCDPAEWLNDCWYMGQQVTAEYRITV